MINCLIALVTEICPFFQCYLNSKGIGKKYKDNLRWIWPSVDRKHGTNSSLTICSSFWVQILFLYERLGILGGDRLFFTFGTHLGRFLKILFRNELVSKLGIPFGFPTKDIHWCFITLHFSVVPGFSKEQMIKTWMYLTYCALASTSRVSRFVQNSSEKYCEFTLPAK